MISGLDGSAEIVGCSLEVSWADTSIVDDVRPVS